MTCILIIKQISVSVLYAKYSICMIYFSFLYGTAEHKIRYCTQLAVTYVLNSIIAVDKVVRTVKSAVISNTPNRSPDFNNSCSSLF
jgi:hypothetical protein